MNNLDKVISYVSDLYNKGLNFKKNRKYSEAIKCFDQAIITNLENGFYCGWYWYNKGLVYEAFKQYIDALECYQKIYPEYNEDWLTKGIDLAKLGNFSGSIQSFDEILKINPCYINAWHNKGVAHQELKNHDSAIKCYDEALKINKNNIITWYSKGRTLISQKKLDDAFQCYEEALKINREYSYAWYNKGFILVEQGKYREAIKCYDEAIRINPVDASSWKNKGICFIKLNQYHEAIKCYDEAIRINPEFTQAWKNKAFALEKINKNFEAVICYENVKKINAKYSEQLKNNIGAFAKLFYGKSPSFCIQCGHKNLYNDQFCVFCENELSNKLEQKNNIINTTAKLDMDIQLSHNSIIKLQNELSKIDTLLKIKLSNLNKMESEQSPSKYKSYQSTIEIIKNEISGDNDKLHDTTNLINKESQILDKLLKDKDILGNKKIKLETDISILVINKIIFINQYL